MKAQPLSNLIKVKGSYTKGKTKKNKVKACDQFQVAVVMPSMTKECLFIKFTQHPRPWCNLIIKPELSLWWVTKCSHNMAAYLLCLGMNPSKHLSQLGVDSQIWNMVLAFILSYRPMDGKSRLTIIPLLECKRDFHTIFICFISLVNQFLTVNIQS